MLNFGHKTLSERLFVKILNSETAFDFWGIRAHVLCSFRFQHIYFSTTIVLKSNPSVLMVDIGIQFIA